MVPVTTNQKWLLCTPLLQARASKWQKSSFQGRTRGPYQNNVPDWSNGLCKNVIHCQPENGDNDTSFWTWCKLLRHLVANTFTKTNLIIIYRQFTLSIFTVKDMYLIVNPLFISLDIIYIYPLDHWILLLIHFIPHCVHVRHGYRKGIWGSESKFQWNWNQL